MDIEALTIHIGRGMWHMCQTRFYMDPAFTSPLRFSISPPQIQYLSPQIQYQLYVARGSLSVTPTSAVSTLLRCVMELTTVVMVVMRASSSVEVSYCTTPPIPLHLNTTPLLPTPPQYRPSVKPLHPNTTPLLTTSTPIPPLH